MTTKVLTQEEISQLSFLEQEQYTVYSQHRFAQCKSKGYRPFLKLQ